MAGEKEKSNALESTIALLMGPVKNDNYIPFQLGGKKKKRKKKSLRLQDVNQIGAVLLSDV